MNPADNEEAVEAVSSTDPQEIARFNNYMDAIYRCIGLVIELFKNAVMSPPMF